jgi:hypothetical protein
MTLIKGNFYTKAGVGFKKPEFQQSTVVINGEKYFFLTIGGEYNNEIVNGELVVHHRLQSQVVQQDTPETSVYHVFVRNSPEENEYEYMGQVDVIKPFDTERNIFTFK